jgi:hypothetical protein
MEKNKEEFVTRAGLRISLKNDDEGVSVEWWDEKGYRESGGCYDWGETVPTKYRYPTKKHEKLFYRIQDEKIVYDLYKKIKSKRWYSKLSYNDVNSIVYKYMKELFGDDGCRYYGTGYVD